MIVTATKTPLREVPPGRALCGRCGVPVAVRLDRTFSGYCRDCKPYAIEAGWIPKPIHGNSRHRRAAA